MKNDLLRLNKHESSISEKNFEDRSPDLKSARKTEIKTVYILTLYFFSILGIGKHHCVHPAIIATPRPTDHYVASGNNTSFHGTKSIS